MKKISRKTLRRRQHARLLALTGLGVLIAVFFASAAASGQAIKFDVSVQQPVTAGAPTTVTIRALDASNDVDKSYKGNHSLSYSGPLNSPLPLPNGTEPSYPANPVLFDQGQALVPITLFNAAATTLTVTESSTGFTGTSGSFTVNHGAPANLEFTTQPPVWTAKNSPFSAAVRVKDAWGNLGTNEPVSVALNKNPTALSCTPSCTVTSDGSTAIATFSLSVSHDAIGYKLRATAGDASADSDFFNVGDAYDKFANGTGPSGFDDPGTTLTDTIVNGAAGNNLAIAVDSSIPIRLDLCSGLQTQVGSGTVFEAVKTTDNSPQPTWTVTLTVKKAALIDTARGAATYDVCLGTRNLSVASGGGTNDCLPNASATSFSTSLSWPAVGGCAVPDDPAHLDTSVYWGNVPKAGASGTNTPANIKSCSDARAPVVLSKSKTGPGNLVIKFCVPYPWDGFGGGH